MRLFSSPGGEQSLTTDLRAKTQGIDEQKLFSSLLPEISERASQWGSAFALSQWQGCTLQLLLHLYHPKLATKFLRLVAGTMYVRMSMHKCEKMYSGLLIAFLIIYFVFQPVLVPWYNIPLYNLSTISLASKPYN
eukprot:2169939-Rhodomonas_salina.1